VGILQALPYKFRVRALDRVEAQCRVTASNDASLV